MPRVFAKVAFIACVACGSSAAPAPLESSSSAATTVESPVPKEAALSSSTVEERSTKLTPDPNRPNFRGGSLRSDNGEPQTIAWNCRLNEQREPTDECVLGDGKPAMEVRPLSGFTRVRHESPLTVHISQGAASQVEISLDSNLAPFVTTRVEDNTLVVGWNGDPFVTHLPAPQLRVTLPEARAVTLAGMGKAEIHVHGRDSFDIEAESAGSAVIEATVKHLRVSAARFGELELRAKVEELRLSAASWSKLMLSGTAKVAEMIATDRGKIDARDLTVEHGSIEVGPSAKVAATFKNAVTVKTVRASDEVTLYGGAKVTDLSAPDARDKIIVR